MQITEQPRKNNGCLSEAQSRKAKKSRAAAKRFQKRMLRSAKAKPLSVIEELKMQHLGMNDGKMSLPKEDKGQWTSPFLCKEEDCYQEYCSKTWAKTQIENAVAYEAVERLILELSRKENQLAAMRDQTPIPLSDAALSSRKPGEGTLSEDFIRVRRERENDKKNAGFFSRLHKLETEIDLAYKQLSARRARILEAESVTRMICGKVENHTKQRMDAYWNGALKTHPSTIKVPPVPDILPKSDAEIVYLAEYNHIEEDVIRMFARRQHILQEKNAANAMAGREKYA